MRAFIIRPFSSRRGIDFDRVEEQLIRPAFEQLGIRGSTTQAFLQSGNVREDMFQQLLVADIVVADISVHNPNVYYELGVRHALQPGRTFLLRSKPPKAAAQNAAEASPATAEAPDPPDEIPFDIRTDRYLVYDSTDPQKLLPTLVDALRQTIASEDADSPVFQMLPNLLGHERSRFVRVPTSYSDEVIYAAKKREVGKLGLLAAEALEFPWGAEGLRIVGREQYEQEVYLPAKRTWEELQRLNPQDREANLKLGIINHRLGDLDASDQALRRVREDKLATAAERSEAIFHLANNVREQWRLAWVKRPSEEMPANALASPLLFKAYERYREAFEENLNNYRAGLQALSILTIALELKEKNREIWEDRFDPEDYDRYKDHREELTASVRGSLRIASNREDRSGAEDASLALDRAHFELLTSARATRVQFEYEKALAGATDFLYESANAQLEIFRQLGVLAAALPKPPAPARHARSVERPARVILFSSRPVAANGDVAPQFPKPMAEAACAKIREILQQEKDRTDGEVLGIGSGASGGDILFHEMCTEVGLSSRLFLPLPHDAFRTASVSPAGREWEDLFDQLLKRSGSYRWLASSETVPIWLSTKKDYTPWQRGSLWLIHEALAIGAKYLTVVTLLEEGENRWFRRYVAEYGAALITIRPGDLQRGKPVTAASAP